MTEVGAAAGVQRDGSLAGVRDVTDGGGHEGFERPAYSVCTIVSDTDQYEAMRASFRKAGFDRDCEYLKVDNSGGNVLDGYQAVNRFLAEARGRYVAIVHQDVRARYDRRADLDARLAELDALDPAWAVAGNAGGIGFARLAMRISDPHGADQRVGDPPCRVTGLDENFIIVRREAGLSVRRDLHGFHLYAADLCIQARLKGRTSYVVDFHLEHLSGGTVGEAYQAARERLVAAYARDLRGWNVTTTVATLPLRPGVLAVLAEAWLRLRRRVRRLRGPAGRARRALRRR